MPHPAAAVCEPGCVASPPDFGYSSGMRSLALGLGALVGLSVSGCSHSSPGSSAPRGAATTGGTSSSHASSSVGTTGGPTGSGSTGGSVSSNAGAGTSGSASSSSGSVDGGCGYQGRGTPLTVSSSIALCLPPVTCTAEVCPPALGDCVNGACVFHAGYAGVATLPEAWATYYCTLSTGGCNGVTQLEPPATTAQRIATARGIPLCEGAPSGTANCVGIAAAPPMVVGNSQEATDPATHQLVADWGLGLTEASGVCYQLTGPGGSAIVALTDRCGGYCKCAGSGFQECGPCVNATDMATNCPCVGTAPPAFSACCGNGCSEPVNAECDWCASNNHPHFDLDVGTFNLLCASLAGNGSCQLSAVQPVSCLDPSGWPPGSGTGSSSGGTTGGSCPANAFQCTGTQPHQEQLSGTGCCCDWNACPSSAGTCEAAPSSCGAGSCTCAAGQPDATHAQVPATGCCCLAGLTPQADGSCN